MGAENIQVFGDSQLIVNQVHGVYQAKDDNMIQYLAVVQCLLKKLKSYKLSQIPREQNSQADALANLGSSLETNSLMRFSNQRFVGRYIWINSPPNVTSLDNQMEHPPASKTVATQSLQTGSLEEERQDHTNGRSSQEPETVEKDSQAKLPQRRKSLRLRNFLNPTLLPSTSVEQVIEIPSFPLVCPRKITMMTW
ncbi:uncharacterized protein LOC125594968 [Brassica napus]|uniref:uncharacterized protein LOC125594968 n=1 Tax=Brassica napus TaxID=3708 RepID=UPI00207871E7|nr:uncharacterized protein LOC125594968 [Brassica napus]